MGLPAMNTTPRTPSPLDRRTVVSGAAWAVPAIALGTSAPAFAASECLSIPTINNWRMTDQDVNEKPFRIIRNNSTLEAIIDWAWWNGKSRPALGYGWATTPLRVEPGHRYTIRLGLETCKGYNWYGSGSPESCETNNTTLDVSWIPSGGQPVSLFKGSTQSTSGYEHFEPPANCSGPVNNRPPRWSGVTNREVTFDVPCGAPSTGTLQLQFTAYPHKLVTSPGSPRNASKTRFSNQNNDDWRVTPTVVSCERIASC